MRVRPSAPPEYRCSGRINYPRFFVPDLLTLVRALNWPYRPRDNGRDSSAWGSSASSSLRFGINALENVRRDGPLGPLFPRMCCRTRCRIASDAGSVCRRPGLCRLSHGAPSPRRPGAKRSTPLDAHSPVRGGRASRLAVRLALVHTRPWSTPCEPFAKGCNRVAQKGQARLPALPRA